MMKLLTPLYHKSNILKFNDYVILQNFLFAYDHSHNTLSLSLQNIFIPVTNIHEHNTRNSTQKYLSLPLTNGISVNICMEYVQSLYIHSQGYYFYINIYFILNNSLSHPKRVLV